MSSSHTRIEALTERLALEASTTASSTRHWSKLYWLSALVWTAVLGLTTAWVAHSWPDLAYLPENLLSSAFVLDVLLWLLLSIVSAHIAYQSSFPVWPSPRTHQWLKRTASVLAVALFGSALARAPGLHQIAAEVHHELDWNVGPCGIFILISGFFSAGWMAFVIRRAAPTQLIQTGAWSAGSAAAFSVLCMHLVCRHDTMTHILLWHVLPAVILVLLGIVAARKVLAW